MEKGTVKIYAEDGSGTYFQNDGAFRRFLRGNMNKKFTVELCSDLSYEEMVADISYENHALAMVTQEKGLENMEIEIYPPPEELSSWKFLINDFIETIQFAKNRLSEFQKIPDEEN